MAIRLRGPRTSGVQEALRDGQGRLVVAGERVRIMTEPLQEGEVRRVVPRYGVLTVIVDAAKAGKAERMVRAQEVEVLGAPG